MDMHHSFFLLNSVSPGTDFLFLVQFLATGWSCEGKTYNNSLNLALDELMEKWPGFYSIIVPHISIFDLGES